MRKYRSLEVAAEVLESQRARGYAGYDPFDGLNSRLLQLSRLDRYPLVRLVWLQANKVLPVNLRPLLGVPRRRNPKGVALFILGLLQDHRRTGLGSYLAEALKLADWLLDNASDRGVWGHYCWGYHFDWQARAFYVPQGKPNVITTSYIARALHQLSAASGEKRYQDVAVDAAYFVLKHLLTPHPDGGHFIAYIPGESAFVHNASLWGAATLAQAYEVNGDQRLADTALAVSRLSLAQQRHDGAWVYGARHHHQFVDGFHTGYNLEALSVIAATLNSRGDFACADEFVAAIQRGLAYYREHFFLPDGTPKYYDDRVYPIDLHSSSQAILTFLALGNAADRALVDKVVTWTLAHMYRPQVRAFRYQRRRFFSNNVDYSRWTQAWAYYSLAYYNRYIAEQEAMLPE